MITIDNFIFVLTLFAVLGCGLIAGIFFAFSAFIMKALSRLPSHEGITAMQFINVAIINPYFLVVFLGTPAACLIAIAYALFRWHNPAAVYLLVGGAIYLIGSFMVTVLFNIPLNNSLASVTPTGPDGAREWKRYVSNWTAWNSIRTAASLAAAALLTIALTF
jgi:uncharacterized membrane protein